MPFEKPDQGDRREKAVELGLKISEVIPPEISSPDLAEAIKFTPVNLRNSLIRAVEVLKREGFDGNES